MLLELVLLAAFVLTAGSFLFAQGTQVTRDYYKIQLRVIAKLLSGDLRELQGRALFPGDSVTRSLKTNYPTNTKSYGFYESTKLSKQLRFRDYNCADVYFDEAMASVSFSNIGAPSASGWYRLRHNGVDGFSYRVQVEPVSGRVTLNEEK